MADGVSIGEWVRGAIITKTIKGESNGKEIGIEVKRDVEGAVGGQAGESNRGHGLGS
jgi:hypothetical protein